MSRRGTILALVAAGGIITVVACLPDDKAVVVVEDAGPTPDAGADAPQVRACDLAAPWGQPVAVTSVNSTSNEQKPWITPDERTIYFSSRRALASPALDGGISRLFLATRTDPQTDSFGAAVLLDNAVNRAATENVGAALSSDRRRLYFASRSGASFVIHQAVRPNPTPEENWSGATVTPIGALNAGLTEFSPTVANDGTLYFARAGASVDYNIYRANPSAGGAAFDPASLVSELVSSQDDSDPMISPDNLTIYFSSSRSGSTDTDIWMSTRATAGNTRFSDPVRVAELSSAGSDSPGWISEDGCRVYIVSSRDPGVGLDLFVSSKPK